MMLPQDHSRYLLYSALLFSFTFFLCNLFIVYTTA